MKEIVKQHKFITVFLVISLVFGAIFLWPYFSLIALAAIVAYLTNPIYKRFLKLTRNKIHLSLWLTFVFTLFVILIPVTLFLIISIQQAISLIDTLRSSPESIGGLQGIINYINSNVIDKIPNQPVKHVDIPQITSWLKDNVGTITKSTVNVVADFAGGVVAFFTKAVIFIFVYLSFLRNQDKIRHLIQKLDPLSDNTTDLYLKRMAAMTSAVVKGQLAIAILQGFFDALLLWIVGFDYIVFWFALLTFLSIIPLGGGIIVYPVGIIMLLTGNIWQGLVLILGHTLIVTNIDNVLRPRFVPKEASLDPALMILSVFAGIAMFGFLGVIIGPVLMVVIVTTIQVYLDSRNRSKT
jgi:predicted PurR-regulated permease PerM